MKRQNWLKLAIVCLFVFSVFVFYADIAQAQVGSGASRDMMEREGVSGSLATKEFDQSKLPGKGKIGFAFGSLVAMVAVLKWL